MVCLRDTFSAAQQATLRAAADAATGTALSREAAVLLAAKLNEIVQGDLFYDGERFEGLTIPAELLELTNEAIGDQNVLLANRRFFEHLFNPYLDKAAGGVRRWFGRKTLGLVDWARNQVYVTQDGTTIMCDDMPLLIGENLKWQQAPIFSQSRRGQTFWIFEHVSPETCEHIAFHSAWPTTLGKAVWHLVKVILDQPGHRVGGATYASLEFAEALNQLLSRKPISGYEQIGDWGKWLASAAIGPRSLALVGGSFQGMHTSTTTGNIFLFWLTVLAGDVIRTAGPATILNLARDLVLSFITLMNFGGPRLGPSTLPDNPAQNHLKQGPIESLMNTLFMMWLVSYYKREDYSIEIFSAGDRRNRAFTLWFGGGLAMSLLTGTVTSVTAQIIAWAEDWPRLGKTLGFTALDHVLKFWLIVYLQKEGDTDDGRFTTAGAQFRGYPDKATSPYRLPWAKGTALFAGQSNMGLWSHNDISASSRQLYAVDFGFDYRQEIRAARGGIVQFVFEGNTDNTAGTANQIVIMHTATDAVHDDPRGTGAVTTYARYLHGAQFGVTAAFALRGQVPAVGTAVNQGDVIMLADDTGTSFHSHLHMDVLLDQSLTVVAAGAANPGTVGIPFVFREIRGDGYPVNLTWYESENG
jgi:hypothetical protein